MPALTVRMTPSVKEVQRLKAQDSTWPLTCIYCGSERVYYSEYQNDVRCQVCGEWQLTEEDD